jgi:hypothetical protein
MYLPTIPFSANFFFFGDWVVSLFHSFISSLLCFDMALLWTDVPPAQLYSARSFGRYQSWERDPDALASVAVAIGSAPDVDAFQHQGNNDNNVVELFILTFFEKLFQMERFGVESICRMVESQYNTITVAASEFASILSRSLLSASGIGKSVSFQVTTLFLFLCTINQILICRACTRKWSC